MKLKRRIEMNKKYKWLMKYFCVYEKEAKVLYVTKYICVIF